MPKRDKTRRRKKSKKATDEEREDLPIIQVCEGLYIGGSSHIENKSQVLIDINPKIVLNCAWEYDYESKPDIQAVWTKLPIREADPVSFLENMDNVIDCIDTARKHNLTVYLHSKESRSRAAALAAYYMMLRHNQTYREVTGNLNYEADIEIDQCFEDILTLIQD